VSGVQEDHSKPVPTYGYHCESCGSDFEVWQRMTDEAAAACPSCRRPGRRLFFPAGIVFRGTGFYKTDSRKPDGASTKTTSTGTPTSGGASEKSTSPPTGAGSD